MVSILNLWFHYALLLLPWSSAYGVAGVPQAMFAAGTPNFGLNGNTNAGAIGTFDAFVVKYDRGGGG